MNGKGGLLCASEMRKGVKGLYPRRFETGQSPVETSRGLTVKEFNNGTQSVPFEFFNGLKVRGEIKDIVIHGFIGQGILGIGSFKEVHLTFHTNQLHKIKGVGRIVYFVVAEL